MFSSVRSSAKIPFGLFCLAVIFFVLMGPVRAMRGPFSYDFASLYGAAKSWVEGANPYDMDRVAALVHKAGYDAENAPNYLPVQPSVYLPTTFPLLAPLTWMRWNPARLIWACLGTVLFACSLLLFIPRGRIADSGTPWLVLALAFCFTPASLGLSHGNPSVAACGLTMLSVYLVMQGRDLAGAFALGVVHCLKPQISITAVVLFALWGYWRVLFLSFALPVVVSVICILRAPSLAEFGHWVMSLQQAIAAASTPGSVNDPSPANQWGAYSMVNLQTVFSIWVHNSTVVNVLTWLTTWGLIGCYLAFRSRLDEDVRARDMAFFSAVGLLVVYHRFYDEQLLLMAIPFLLAGNWKKASAISLWACLIALALPLHIGSDFLRHHLRPDTFAGLFLLRPLPLIVTAMCGFLIPWTARASREQTEATTPGAARSKVAGR